MPWGHWDLILTEHQLRKAGIDTLLQLKTDLWSEQKSLSYSSQWKHIPFLLKILPNIY